MAPPSSCSQCATPLVPFASLVTGVTLGAAGATTGAGVASAGAGDDACAGEEAAFAELLVDLVGLAGLFTTSSPFLILFFVATAFAATA